MVTALFSIFVRNYKIFRNTIRLSILSKIDLYSFRNYASASFRLQQGVICIAGPNGSGKTNLLDAIYYLCYTKSYFTPFQQSLAQTGTDGFRITGLFKSADADIQIACRWKEGKKTVTRDGIEYERVKEHIGSYAAVMIAPDDIEIINGGSELRRKWMDGILSQCDANYLEYLLHYQGVLVQRNAWLRLYAEHSSPPWEEIRYYDECLARDAVYLYRCRHEFLREFVPMLATYHRRISANAEPISLVYQSHLNTLPSSDVFGGNVQQDLRMQRTMKGIHRDELEFTINGMLMRQFASQGQKKSFLFAMKLAQAAYLRQKLSFAPLLLLDDLFEKLDQERIEALLSIICTESFAQVILTDTHPDRVVNAFRGSADVQVIEPAGIRVKNDQ